jgi:glycosyltransferase involved in cell wall biosynthesis
MKIAQVAPLVESVPPKLYGGTERIVSYITEELVRLGHEVTLFASGDSKTAGQLRPVGTCALRQESTMSIPQAPLTLLLEEVFQSADDFDLIHSHLDFLPFPLARRCETPLLTTLHGRLDLPELVPVFRKYPEMPLISISHAQRQPLPWANWASTIYHGLPKDLYTYHPKSGDYLAFVGRLTPEKRPDQAIEAAKRAGIPLRIAAKVDPTDQAYFDAVIRPLLDHPLIEYIGEINDAEKDDFIGNAYAILAPFDWPEPFGLVFIEALACGTPIVAYRRGSLPELINQGITGMTCNTFDDLVNAIEQVPNLDRRLCRQDFEERFTVERMVQYYLRVYRELTSQEETDGLYSTMFTPEPAQLRA